MIFTGLSGRIAHVVLTNLTISSLSCVDMDNGIALVVSKTLNKTDFPSITCTPPSGPGSLAIRKVLDLRPRKAKIKICETIPYK
jgi:hypothetical protein